ncbi:hypothetical protein [Mycolicibacterium sp. OfavD-34-C]|nr:hypothetical protein [Mycolicibacterium sp. OfavD-34-C]
MTSTEADADDVARSTSAEADANDVARMTVTRDERPDTGLTP